ncbi:hypothetical protein BH10PSE18_BH10PSE18_30120 [soil metagenome]
MLRKALVVGDTPVPGGTILSYAGPLMNVYGHRIALVGGRVYCEGCNSVGIVAKAGGNRRGLFYGAEIALEGDVVFCRCPVPPPLLSTLQQSMTCDDGLAASVRDYSPSFTSLPGWFAGNSTSVLASSKIVDGIVKHPPEAEQTENICPNMTNKEFCTLVLDLRADAVKMVERRLKDLDLWGKLEKARVKQWFGTDDDGTRQYLRSGLSKCLKVLMGLTCDNFVRYSDQLMRNVGCTPSGNKTGLIAEVCKPDVGTHTIGIALDFCSLRPRSAESDSQLQTLIHEVTHFDDVFGSVDDIYKMGESLAISHHTKRALKNADSLVGYIAYGVSYAG